MLDCPVNIAISFCADWLKIKLDQPTDFNVATDE